MTSSAATTISKSPITQNADPIVTPGHDAVLTVFASQATSTTDRLHACQLGLARLYAQLRWLEENPSEVDDLLETGRSISRRARAIKSLVELELREHRLHGHEPDVELHSPLVKRVVSLLVTTLINVTNEMASADDADEVVSKFKTAIEADTNIPWP